MEIELNRIPVREVIAGYKDHGAEEGVVAYSGKLDIRPKYQREFIYKDDQRNAVIKTIKRGFPLNVMYWMVKEDGNYEVLDGQQRTISIGQYVTSEFILDFDGRAAYFHNLTEEEKNQILDYELMIYFCKGTDKERLEWFTTINTYGEKLNKQEILNAVYTGPWVSDARLKFSKTGCDAYRLSKKDGHLVSGIPIEQKWLETTLSWISGGKDKIENYMAKHQCDQNAEELWQYFQDVIAWVRKTFTTYHDEVMKEVNWGELYNQFKDKKYDTTELEKEIAKLLEDEEISRQEGIYDYVLTGNKRSLNLRTFDKKVKLRIYEEQKGICPLCEGENKKKKWKFEEMEADHINPWHEGGKTVSENCQMLCKSDNRAKSGK